MTLTAAESWIANADDDSKQLNDSAQRSTEGLSELAVLHLKEFGMPLKIEKYQGFDFPYRVSQGRAPG